MLLIKLGETLTVLSGPKPLPLLAAGMGLIVDQR